MDSPDVSVDNTQHSTGRKAVWRVGKPQGEGDRVDKQSGVSWKRSRDRQSQPSSEDYDRWASGLVTDNQTETGEEQSGVSSEDEGRFDWMRQDVSAWEGGEPGVPDDSSDENDSGAGQVDFGGDGRSGRYDSKTHKLVKRNGIWYVRPIGNRSKLMERPATEQDLDASVALTEGAQRLSRVDVDQIISRNLPSETGGSERFVEELERKLEDAGVEVDRFLVDQLLKCLRTYQNMNARDLAESEGKLVRRGINEIAGMWTGRMDGELKIRDWENWQNYALSMAIAGLEDVIGDDGSVVLDDNTRKRYFSALVSGLDKDMMNMEVNTAIESKGQSWDSVAHVSGEAPSERAMRKRNSLG